MIANNIIPLLTKLHSQTTQQQHVVNQLLEYIQYGIRFAVFPDHKVLVYYSCIVGEESK